MALWIIKLPSLEAHSFDSIEPVEVLDALDGPLTFTFRDRDGVLLMANLCAVGANASRYLVSRTTDLSVSELKAGLISLHSALVRPQMWLIDVDSKGGITNVWNVTLDDLPVEVIPDSTALLTPELEAEYSTDSKLARFARSGSDGEIALDGSPVEGHQIDAGFFGGFIASTNDLFTELCKSIGANSASLRLGMTSESSYAVDVNALERTDAITEYFQFNKEPSSERIRAAFDWLMSLIIDEVPVGEAISLVKRNYELRKRYGKVLEFISRSGASVTVRTRARPRRRSMSRIQAGERLRILRELGYPYMHLKVRGRLIGGLVEKSVKIDRSFIIRVQSNESFEDIRGKVSDEAADQMTEIRLGNEVEARLQILEDEEKYQQTYTLIKIVLASETSPHTIE